MNLTKKSLFLILFLCQELISSPVTDSVSSPQYNITKELNDTVVEILQSIEPRIVTEFSTTAVNAKNFDFDRDSEDGDMFDRLRQLKPVVCANETRISYNFVQNKIHYEFMTSLENSSFILGDQNDQWFRVDNDDDNLQINEITIGTEVASKSGTLEPLKRFIASVTSQNINQNNNLIRTLKKICDNQPSKSLTSKYPRFQDQQQQHYYLIPSVTSTYYNFKNITIVGLTNFQSLNITEQPLVYTLVIKNIRGKLWMDCEVKNITQELNSNAELDFTIDSLSISFEPDTKIIRVAARNYSTAMAKSKVKFGELFSTVIMEIMEGAIGASIMPSMTYQRTTKPGPTTGSSELGKEAITPTIEEIMNGVSLKVNDKDIGTLVTKQTTIEETSSTTKSTYTTELVTKPATIAESPRTPRPAYLDQRTKEASRTHPTKSSTKKTEVKTTQPEKKLTTPLPKVGTTNSSIYDTTHLPEDPLDYHISFNNVTIELISRNYSNPEQIQCQLLNNLKFTHKINAMIPRERIGSSNESNSINFHADVGSMNIFVTNPNTTEGGDSCEFQIHLNQVINVKSSPFTNKNVSKKWTQELIKIKKKIDAALMPMAKSGIVRKIKPIVCSSLDLCSQSKKIINDFFDRLVHNVLKKSKYYTSFKTFNATWIKDSSTLPPPLTQKS